MADETKKVKGVVDFVFLIDATGSMGHLIDALKANLNTFIDSMIADPQSPVRDWRGKVFGFRDVEEDGSDAFVDNPFVSKDVPALKAQLASLEAKGGGDVPESLLDALYRVGSMPQMDKGSQELDPGKWRYKSSAARVVIVFTDVPFKEKMAIPEAKGGGLDDVIHLMHNNRIILSIFGPEHDCYDKLAETDKSEAILGDLAEMTAKQENFKKTLLQLAKSVSKSAAVETL